MKRDTLEHPKTGMLQRRLKLDDLQIIGLLERLFLFAEMFARRGDVGRYGAEELAAALKWPRETQELIDALVACRWLDAHDEYGFVLHEWPTHAPAYIHRQLARAGERFASGEKPSTSRLTQEERTAAAQRAPTGRPKALKGALNGRPKEPVGRVGKGREGKGIEGTGRDGQGTGETAVAVAPEQPEALLALWNETAHPCLSRAKSLEGNRKKLAERALDERSLSAWREVIERINASAFCRGESDGRGWRADFDFMLRPATDRHPSVATWILEGKYDDTRRQKLATRFGEKGAKSVEAMERFIAGGAR